MAKRVREKKKQKVAPETREDAPEKDVAEDEPEVEKKTDGDAPDSDREPAAEKEDEERASDESGEDDERAAKDDEAEREDEEDEEDDDERPLKPEGTGASIEKAASGDDEALAPTDAEADEEDEEGAQAAAQLGTDRYVMAGFFSTGMLAAYILGKTISGVWSAAANKDWFSQTFPRLAAVQDDDKTAYSLVIAGILALVLVYRTYKRPDVRAWSDEVASELTKVKWPTKKEVQSSTFVVIVASTAATVYLALLDRLWAFVTNLVYGDGS